MIVSSLALLAAARVAETAAPVHCAEQHHKAKIDVPYTFASRCPVSRFTLVLFVRQAKNVTNT